MLITPSPLSYKLTQELEITILQFKRNDVLETPAKVSIASFHLNWETVISGPWVDL